MTKYYVATRAFCGTADNDDKDDDNNNNNDDDAAGKRYPYGWRWWTRHMAGRRTPRGPLCADLKIKCRPDGTFTVHTDSWRFTRRPALRSVLYAC